VSIELADIEGAGRLQRRFKFIALAAVALVVLAIFLLSQVVGGRTWDESAHVLGMEQQVGLVADWLRGNFTRSYSDLSGDLKYYGVSPILPTYAVLAVFGWLSPTTNPGVIQTWMLHTTGFAYGMGTVFVIYLTLMRLAARAESAWVGAVLLLTYPLWLGYSFFDYKDLATAFFFALAILASIVLLQESATAGRRWMWVLGIATVGIADTKLVALALILPTWLVAFWHFGRMSPGRFVVVCLATTLGIYVTTLPSWTDPFGFAVSSVVYMTHHAWGGCTLTNGACVGTHTVEWSAWRYGLTWLWAQLPLTVLIGIVPALGAALVRGTGRRILAISLVWPIAMIGIENSTLYDGLRHLLFALPLAFALVVLLADQLINRWAWLRAPAAILAIGMLSLAIVDDIRLFPFNYSYFNLVARQWADETWFETDYWGFSLKQAAEIASPLTANKVGVAAMPSFLATPFLPPGTPVVDLDKQGAPASFQQSYVLIYITRLQRPARSKCKEVGNVSRSLALTKVNMKLAVIDICGS
jgi:hypothetical protein